MDERPGEFKHLIQGLFRERRKGPVLTVNRLRKHWHGILGEELGRKTYPVRLRGGILWLATPDSSWAFNLQFVKEEILDSVRTFLESDEIEEVRFVVGEIPPPGNAPGAAPLERPPDDAPPDGLRGATTVGDGKPQSLSPGKEGASEEDRPAATIPLREERAAAQGPTWNAAAPGAELAPEPVGRDIRDARVRAAFARAVAKLKRRRGTAASEKNRSREETHP